MEGERWGSYVLEERIGAGGMAEVFRARRVGAASFSRLVCIKRLHPHLSADPEFTTLFLDEARTGAKLRHRNIVGIDDLGEHGGQYFLAMEYVNGVDLARLEQRAWKAGVTFPADVGVFLAAELLTALDAAHGAVDPDDGQPLRVVHRDVSPHNVLVSYGGEVKLTDFGIARAERRARVTQGAVVRGRFGYMPLEQASGRDLDARADLFALGVTLFELLTGRRPFRGDDPDATLESIIAAQVIGDRPSLGFLRPDLPPALRDLIEALLATAPEDRPRDAATALDALSSLPERVTGGATLIALMATLYPSHASVAYVPRASVPPPIRPTSSPSTAPAPPSTAPPPTVREPASGVDPFAATRARPVLALMPEGSTGPTTTAVMGVSSSLPRAAGARAPGSRRITAWGAVLAVALALGGGVVLAARTRPPASPATPITTASLAPRSTPAPSTPPSTPAPSPPPSTPATIAPSAPAPPAAPTSATPSAPFAHGAAPRPATAHPAPRASTASPTPTAPTPTVPTPATLPTAPATTAPMPAPPPAPATGTLRVNALPWGEVSVDGRSYGRTPVTIRVPAGEHTVRITGGVEHTERVVVPPNGDRFIHAGDE